MKIFLKIAACSLVALSGFALDLSNALVVAPSNFSKPEQNAVRMLLEEVQKRTRLQLTQTNAAAGGGSPVISIEHSGTGAAEGFEISVRGNGVSVKGNDTRGVLFGVGRLLRELRMGRDSLS